MTPQKTNKQKKTKTKQSKTKLSGMFRTSEKMQKEKKASIAHR